MQTNLLNFQQKHGLEHHQYCLVCGLNRQPNESFYALSLAGLLSPLNEFLKTTVLRLGEEDTSRVCKNCSRQLEVIKSNRTAISLKACKIAKTSLQTSFTGSNSMYLSVSQDGALHKETVARSLFNEKTSDKLPLNYVYYTGYRISLSYGCTFGKGAVDWSQHTF